MVNSYFLKLDRFEGPLDLLLHLIKVHELSIFEIDLYELTDQYLNYLRLVKYQDLGDAGSFLDMAAALIDIKTKKLLPVEDQSESLDSVNLEDEDPAERLKKQLIEYETFKAAGLFFSSLPMIGCQIHTSHEAERLAEDFSGLEQEMRGDSSVLTILYEQMLSQLVERKKTTVKAKSESMPVGQAMVQLIAMLSIENIILFDRVIARVGSRYELIAYILGLLQLIREGKLKILQESEFGTIWIYGLTVSDEQLEDFKNESIQNDSRSI